MTSILGISAYYHDSAATLVVDGELVAAAQEERFSRIKNDRAFPQQAVEFCLEKAGLSAEELDFVAYYDKPMLTFDRLLETYLAVAPRGFASFLLAMPQWLREKLHLPREIRHALSGRKRRTLFLSHHESHAASAFFPSPFQDAAILTVDGVGEWATATIGEGRGAKVTLLKQLDFPHSLGLLYSAFTYYCGFAVNSGEYKLMGLAPYGQPRYASEILETLIDLKEDGSFRMDLSYFNFCQGLTMTSERFHTLFGAPARTAGMPIETRHMDLAASVQVVAEEILLRMARHAWELTGHSRLCLAGGVALNCVANGRMLREGPFEEIWVQPAAGDAGGSLGAALFTWHQLLGNPRVAGKGDRQQGSFLGPAFTEAEIRGLLDKRAVCYETIAGEDRLCELVAEDLARGDVVGWHQGAMEFGPRALGARSILADARDPLMQRKINLKVKFREGFRPFAPMVLEERAHEFFEIMEGRESPYMLFVDKVHPDRRVPLDSAAREAAGFEKLAVLRSEIPAVTHVDDSARMQTVDRSRHGLTRKLIEAFDRKTGCPVLVNTSFNLSWEPIVCSPEDSLDTFFSSGIDTLCIGQHLVRKRDQPAWVGEEELSRPPRIDQAPWSSPCCGAPVGSESAPDRCSECGQLFSTEEGIARFYWPHEGVNDSGDVTRQVQAFYEENPFPNYDDHDSVRSLVDKSRRSGYARWLDDAIPAGSDVLEVGCGTGQLSNFLGIACRRVIGVDLCLNSLRLGERFRREQRLPQVRFAQMNLFRPCFWPGSFDVILCNGVLHHTSDPFGGFEKLWPLLKPGGRIVVGLYNRYGRAATHLRRGIFRLTGGKGRFLDPYLRGGGISPAKRRAWYADQYQHPRESSHTFGEVQGWFDRCGLEFVNSVPTVAWSLKASALEGGGLFESAPAGSKWDRFATQAKMVLSGSREGGFFVMIGRRPVEASGRGEA